MIIIVFVTRLVNSIVFGTSAEDNVGSILETDVWSKSSMSLLAPIYVNER